MFIEVWMDPLAQTLITPELLRLIAEVDEFKGRGRGTWYERT